MKHRRLNHARATQFSIELAQLQRDRLSLVEEILLALHHAQRIWTEIITPITRVWIASARGIAVMAI